MNETGNYEWRYLSEEEPQRCDRCASIAPTVELPGKPLQYSCRFCAETYLGQIVPRDPALRELFTGLCQAFNLLDNTPHALTDRRRK
jgi:hypothetical protein